MTEPVRVYCYRSFDYEDYDRLAQWAERLGGWFSLGPIWIELYVPQHRSEFLVLMNSDMERWPQKDWIL